MFSLNSVTKIDLFVITAKGLQTRMLPQCQQVFELTSIHASLDLFYSCVRFPEFAEFLFHLGKAPLFLTRLTEVFSGVV